MPNAATTEVESRGAPELGAVLAALAAAKASTDGALEAALADVVQLGAEEQLARLIVGTLVLRNPVVLQLPHEEAIRQQMDALKLVAELDAVSVWVLELGDRVHCIGSRGRHAVTRRTREHAQRLIRSEPEFPPTRRVIHGVAVLRGGRPVGAIVLRGPGRGRELAQALAREAGQMIAVALERSDLLHRSEERLRVVVQASERRLARLTFDMHDGPAQDILALLSEVRLFRGQLGDALHDRATKHIIVGRVDDLEARLLALDADLREVIQSFQTPGLLERPLPEVLADEAENVRSRDGIDCVLQIRGEFSERVTASQRIAIVRVIQESLSNVRVHSGATSVRVVVTQNAGGVRIKVTDDGRGFDVERTLIRSARRGRLGLLGMAERIRLLGGTFDVTSKPGGPTVIYAHLPEWRPAVLEPQLSAETPRQHRRQR
jgi:signal transduction histidine kinase